MLSKVQITESYPLHCSVVLDDLQGLRGSLEKGAEVDKKDHNGFTALQLCSLVANTAAAEVLLSHGANPDVEDEEGWSIVQECIASGNFDMAKIVFNARKKQRGEKRSCLVNELLTKLSNAPDFYCEMKWDFTSWIPLVARMCPSDTYKIYKSGPAVRIDSTLTGFDQNNWKRGHVTFMFLANESGCEIYDINHEAQTITLDRINMSNPDSINMSTRQSSPLTCSRIRTDNVEFWREKAGLIGFRSDRTEDVSGYECSVFSTSGIEIVTRERVEHLTPEQRAVVASKTSMFESLLTGSVVSSSNGDVSQGDQVMPTVLDDTDSNSPDERSEEKLLSYFNTSSSTHIVRFRTKEQTDKVQKFKARVWLSQNHPLSLQEQLIPIIELMSTGNTHFSKLKDFITLQLPAGFPVNIEIPLYHMINARITFSNINSATSPVDGVMCLAGPQHDRESTSCVVDAHIFHPPHHYIRTGGGNERLRTTQQQQYLSDEHMLQYAIQQSILSGDHVNEEEDDELTWIEALAAVGDREPLPDSNHLLQQHIQQQQQHEHLARQLSPQQPSPQQPCPRQPSAGQPYQQHSEQQGQQYPEQPPTQQPQSQQPQSQQPQSQQPPTQQPPPQQPQSQQPPTQQPYLHESSFQVSFPPEEEDEMQHVLRLSLEAEQRRQEGLLAQEEEELARIIALSLNDW